MDLNFPPKRLTQEHEILPFTCGDGDLDNFLFEDAKAHCRNLLSVTYLVEADGMTAAFFSLLNDKISYDDIKSHRKFDKLFKSQFPKSKWFKSYPAVKIGRFATHMELQGQNVGTLLLDYIKYWFSENNKTGCMYITVDAYKNSIPFYLKNKFQFMTNEDENMDTRLMFYNLSKLKDN